MLATQNPLDRIFELDSGRMRTGLVIGICGALIVHVAAASEAARIAAGMGNWALDLRTDVHAYLAKFYEVDLVGAAAATTTAAGGTRPGARSTQTGSRRIGRDTEGRASSSARTGRQDPHPGAGSQRACRPHRRGLRHRQRRRLRGRSHRQQRHLDGRGAKSQRCTRGRSGRYRHQGGPDRAPSGPDLIASRIGCGRSRLGLSLSRRSGRRPDRLSARAHHGHRSDWTAGSRT